MMKIKSIYATSIYFLLIAITFSQTFAQIPTRMGPAPIVEINKAQAFVEANMLSPEAHKAYIYAKGLGNPLLIVQYKEWMKKYPKNVIIPLTLGSCYSNAEMPQAKEFLLKSAEMEPNNAKIWRMLYEDALRRGQNELGTDYLKKASMVDSSNVSYAYHYISSLQNSHPKQFKEKVIDFTKRNPASEDGASALYSLAYNTKNIRDKIQYFEELRKLYPPQKFRWSASGMVWLADIYLQTDADKALEVINEMNDEGDWAIRKVVAKSLIQINKLEKDKNFKQAILELNIVKLPRYNYINDFIALKKASLLEHGGNPKNAYDSLAVRFAKLPTDELYTALEQYGKEIGKDKTQVINDIETIRNSAAFPAYPFDLGRYTSNEKLNLNDLKGKVVLLTFWFPGCGPCGEEFPHFQAVIDKFKGKNVEYIGINVTPRQDLYVLSFLKNNKYSFIPLRGNPVFAATYYGVEGEPENFLIDKAGKIIFKNFRINDTNHRTLELMITSLL